MNFISIIIIFGSDPEKESNIFPSVDQMQIAFNGNQFI